jgi:hypothetical protein
LNASDGGLNHEFGFAVALSADGKTALVGAQNTESANVFVKSGAWNQQAELTSYGGNYPGGSVALSADGNTAMVGNPTYSTYSTSGENVSGIAFVYVNGGTWQQAYPSFQLTPNYGAKGDEFGFAVALSADGNTVLVGAIYHATAISSYCGSAFVFARDGMLWREQAELIASDGAVFDQFGGSVALSADGNTALIGAQYHVTTGGQETGSVYAFERSGSQWGAQQEFTSSDGTGGDEFGYYVALSGDGGTALIGAPDHATASGADAGSAYVFVNGGTHWSQQVELSATDAAAYTTFGYSVAMSGDGNTAIVGAPGGHFYLGQLEGSAYVYVKSGTNWGEEAELTANDGTFNDEFGDSVAINGDGTTALVGAPNRTTTSVQYAGSVYVFVSSGTNWSQQAELTSADGEPEDNFGFETALSADGKSALVGAAYENTEAGSAYLFTSNGTLWSPGPELTGGITASAFDQFGFSIAYDGTTAIVGAPQASPSNGPGYAFVFDVGELPEITGQPQSETVLPGAGVTFRVTASGAGPLSYQWRENGNPITSATGTSYTISTTGTGDSGSYDVVVSNDGGTVTSAEAVLVVNSLSQLNQVPPGSEPQSNGYLIVNLSPATFPDTPLLPGWRFVGSQQWQPSGAVVGGLKGTYGVEYEPVPGYIQPKAETVDVISGGPATVLDRTYYNDSGTEAGGITVTLKPGPVVTSGSGQWEFVGEDGTQWRNSGVTVSSLPAGSYLVECKPVAGYATPTPVAVDIQNGITSSVSIAYYLPDAPAGTPPAVVPYQTVTTGTNLPYAYVGQIQSDAGSATGFVVARRVVATAAHVVFNDATLEATTGLQWLFEEYAGTNQPTPLVPRGFYDFTGYASQRAKEGTPGQSLPASQNLDAAALYFLEDAGEGGYSGYLASDSTDNEFLESANMKILVGYPVDGIPVANQGQIFATAPANVSFSRVPGVTASGTAVGVSGSAYRIYTTTDITSAGGNSGGPLCVQVNGGDYFPAAIYLGGSQETVVRAIDGDVVNMFTLAEASGNGGGNQNSGGIVETNSPINNAALAGANLKVTIAPEAARAEGATWTLEGGTANGSGTLLTELSPGVYTLEFSTVAGFVAPSTQPITLSSGTESDVTFTYSNDAPPVITSPLVTSGTHGSPLATYQVTASNGPTAFAASNLPTGLSMTDTAHGIIGGTPEESGSFAATIQAINASGTDSETLTFYIAPQITSASIANATVGQGFAYAIMTGTGDVVSSYGIAGTLPEGLTADTVNGIVSGTAEEAGLYNLTISASNNGGMNSVPLALLVSASGANNVLLNVSKIGLGTVTNVGTGEALSLPAQLVGVSGTSYTFSASGGAGSFFGGWTGGVESTDNPLQVTVTSGEGIVAVFSSFGAAAGNYMGLVGSNPASISDGGTVTLKLDSKGRYTGKMVCGGISYKMAGAFDATGGSTPSLSNGGPAVRLHLDTAGGFPEVTGSAVVSGTETEILAKEAGYSKAQPFGLPGRYTALIVPAGNNAVATQGIGYGALIVSKLGTVKFAGVLNDGTKLSVESTIAADQTWPFYAAPYKNGGYVAGWVTFAPVTGTSDFSGTLEWCKAGGFQTEEMLLGSAYHAPGRNKSILGFADTMDNASLTLGSAAPVALTISPRNVLEKPAPANLSLKVNTVTGLFSGKSGVMPFGGAVFQTGGYGEGLIMSGTGWGEVYLGAEQ